MTLGSYSGSWNRLAEQPNLGRIANIAGDGRQRGVIRETPSGRQVSVAQCARCQCVRAMSVWLSAPCQGKRSHGRGGSGRNTISWYNIHRLSYVGAGKSVGDKQWGTGALFFAQLSVFLFPQFGNRAIPLLSIVVRPFGSSGRWHRLDVGSGTVMAVLWS